MESSDWHIFVGVARHGSTLAASRELRVSQSTVSRRIDALEAVLGVRLFDRRPSGYALTDAGRHLLPRAEGIRAAVSDALSAMRQHKRGLVGQVRFTTMVVFAQTFLYPAVRDFRTAYPDISVELVATEDRLDLLAGEADVALRAGPAPDVPGLVARRVLTDGWSVWCSRDYAAARGKPERTEDLGQHPVVTLSKDFGKAPFAEWLDDTVPEKGIVMRAHDVPGLLAGLVSGVGVGMMSNLTAEAAGLLHCFAPPVKSEAPVWLITTESLRHEPRIRAFVDFLAGYLAQGRYRSIALNPDNAHGSPAPDAPR
jgi:DNA-binding transcriptional LysR family regulator